MTRELRGGHVLAAALERAGVDTVFTLCGNHILPAYEGLIDAGIDLVDTRTEAGAVMAADAYARATRRPAVALVTGGPGHTNALTGLATAHAVGSPVVLLSGSTERRLVGRGAQQEMDQVSAAEPLCKWAAEVMDLAALPGAIDEAFRTAMSGTTGAVHLSLPVDVLSAPAAGLLPLGPGGPVPERGTIPAAFVGRVTEMLRQAQRPVAVVGTGAYMHEADAALRTLGDVTGLPVFTIDLAHGMLAGHRCTMGYADPALNGAARLIAEADVVLLLGKWLDFRLRFGAESVIAADARLVQVAADTAELGRNREPDLAAAGDIAAFTAALVADLHGDHLDFTAWSEKLTTAVGPPSGRGADPPGGGFHPYDVARTLASCLPANVGLTLDAGDFVAWCRSVLTAPGPGRWLRLGPMSTCGAAVPMALGLRRARPDEPVVVITGDGSFGYHLIEFEAAARQRLPFVAVVGNNRSWGIEQIFQRELYGEEYVRTTELSDIRYDEVVRALGGYGEHVTSLAELPAALDRALASGVPACLDIPVALVGSSLAEGVVARRGEI